MKTAADCTAGDWQSVLEVIAAWSKARPRTPFLITLPDGRSVQLAAMPHVSGPRLAGLLTEGPHRLLVISHEGDSGLRIRFTAPAASRPVTATATLP